MGMTCLGNALIGKGNEVLVKDGIVLGKRTDGLCTWCYGLWAMGYGQGTPL